MAINLKKEMAIWDSIKGKLEEVLLEMATLQQPDTDTQRDILFLITKASDMAVRCETARNENT